MLDILTYAAAKKYTDSKVTPDPTVFKFQGTKEFIADLPESGNVGDVWLVEEDGNEYYWLSSESRWEAFGSPIISGEVDDEMSDESENAVQNRVIKGYVDDKIDTEINLAIADERLRVQLRDILRSKGKTVADDATLATLIPLVNSVGINDEFKKMCEGQQFELVDSEGIITTIPAQFITDSYKKKITKVDLPECTSLGESVFSNGTTLISVKLPKCTSFGNSTLGGETGLTALQELVLSNNIASIGNLFLVHCPLTELHLGNIGTIGYRFLQNCSNLVVFKMDSCTSINMGGTTAYSFQSVNSLKIADFGNVSAFTSGDASNTFKNATNMKAVVIRKTDGVATLGTVNAFKWLLNNVTGWYIYVPDDLVDAYKADSKWSTFADYFKPLSEYDEEAILNG